MTRHRRSTSSYGSIGSEPGGSLLAPVGGVLPPYWVFKALPSICSDKLPSGLRHVRLHRRAGTRPADRRVAAPPDRHRSGRAQLRGLPHRHRPRCARRAAQHRARMPAHQLDLESFVQFVLDCSLDNRTDGRRRQRPIARSDGRARRCSSACSCGSGSIDRLKTQTLEPAEPHGAASCADAVPRWGRGRVDTFNPYKAIQFNWRLDEAAAYRS